MVKIKSPDTKLGKERIEKLLISLSAPAILAMMGSALYNLVDTIFIGRWVGVNAIGGLAIAFPIQTLIISFSHLIGIGAASALSRSLGAGNRERANTIGGNAFLFLVLLGLFIAFFGTVFVEPIIRLFGATDTILPYAKDYVTIIFLGNVFFSLAVSGNDLIRAEGSARIAMYSMFIGAIMNIILDPVFILGFNMGMRGAAIATIISQTISFIYVMYYFYSDKSSLNVRLCHLKPDFPLVKEILAVGLAPFVRHVAGSLVGIVINHSLKIYGGDIALSTFGIINRLMLFKAMPLFGVIQGMQPIIGYNYGAGYFDRVKKAINMSMALNIIIGVTGYGIVLLFPSQIIGLFTTDNELIEMGREVLIITFAMVPIIGIHVVGTGVFQALGKARIAFFLALLRKILLLIPLVLIIPRFTGLGLIGIWISYPISDFISTLITYILIKKENSRFDRVSLESDKILDPT